MTETHRIGRGRVTEMDRSLAAAEIKHAHARGVYDGEEAARRLVRVRVANTQSALRVAVTGRADTGLPMLEAAPRVALVLWLFIGFINVVVWLLIGMIGGGWDPVWLICVLVGGGILVAGIRGVRDHGRRVPTADPSLP